MGILANGVSLSDMGNVSFDNITYNVFMNKHVAVRVTVATVCCLSMIGAIFVILSYACFKDLRSQARQILVNLSLMDFGVGLANFTGIAINFDRLYMNMSTGALLYPSNTVRALCQGQAFIAFFSTYGSVFWTISLAVYMYLLVFQDMKRTNFFGRVFLVICYMLNYSMAIGLCLWFLFTNRFGNSPYGSTGWCGVVIERGNDRYLNYIGIVIGYDVWIYLTMILCTAIYVSIFIHLNIKWPCWCTILDERTALSPSLWNMQFCLLKDVVSSRQYWSNALHFLDYKLIFIPVVFVLLRMWTCINSFLFVYLNVDVGSFPKWLGLVLILLSGIGDSGQGAANGLLFVLFTSKVRNAFVVQSKRCYTIALKREIGGTRDETQSFLQSRPRTSSSGELTPSTSLNYGHSGEERT